MLNHRPGSLFCFCFAKSKVLNPKGLSPLLPAIRYQAPILAIPFYFERVLPVVWPILKHEDGPTHGQ